MITTAAALLPPDCQDTAPAQEVLNVHTANLSVPDYPFGLVYASNDSRLTPMICFRCRFVVRVCRHAFADTKTQLLSPRSPEVLLVS
jgi:hypothetical protein